MKRKNIFGGLCVAAILTLLLSACAGQEGNMETAASLPTPTEVTASDAPTVSVSAAPAVSDEPDAGTPTPEASPVASPTPMEEAEASPVPSPTPTDEPAVKPDILEWYWEIDGVGSADLKKYVLSDLIENEEMLSFELLLVFFETEIEDVYVGALEGWFMEIPTGEDRPLPTPSPSKYDVYTFAENAIYFMSSQNFPLELQQELLGVEDIRAFYFRTTKETWQREQKRAYAWICGVKDKVIYYVYPYIAP